MSDAHLTLERVDKFYGAKATGVHAVRDVNMQVEKGEIVALLGSSGCGKTSTLRMIAGFEEVSGGEIELAGRPIHKLPPVRRNVAMAFEGYSLYPPLTVGENIEFALKSSKLPKTEIEYRVAHITQLLEIDDILDRYPVSISGGQQQRASLGRALIRDADLHLLDEPMGQLEPQLRAILRGRIKHFIKERGLSAILVTHDQTEANALADRIAVMEEGALQQFDTPAQIKAQPSNLFSGTFIGEPPMNVFPAQVSITNDQVQFSLPDSVELAYSVAEFSAEVLAALRGLAQVTIGVRPYAVHRASQGPVAQVTANQWLGDQTHIASTFAGGMLVLVEHDRVRLQPGEELHIAIQPDDIQLFHSDSGAAIAHGRNLA